MPDDPDDASISDAVHHPHDALFRRVFGRPVHAASELVSVLAPEIAQQIDLESLTLVPGSHVDDDLRQYQSDLLFTADLAGHQAFVYVLIEHQSRPDPLMAFRVLKYVVRIWDDYRRAKPNGSTLPAVVPIVVYQGSRPWTGPTNLADLIDTGPDLVGLLPQFAFILDDLRNAGETALRSRPLTVAARITLALLGLSAAGADVIDTVRPWLRDLRELWDTPDGPDILVSAITYLSATTEDATPTRLVSLMKEVGPEAEEAAMTIAQHLHAEGKREGRAEGRLEGEIAARQQLLTDLLTRRFGPLDDGVLHRLQTGAPDDVAIWIDRLIDGATTLDEIFS